MKRLLSKISILLLLMAGLSGCYLKSVHPLITEETAIFVETLDGIYETDEFRWTFASNNDPEILAQMIKTYDDADSNVDADTTGTEILDFTGYLIMRESLDDQDKKPDLFIGLAGYIGSELFINIQLFDLSETENTFVNSHIFNVNTFSRLTLNAGEVSLEPFASSWIRDQVLNNRVRIKHEVVKGMTEDGSEVLITASTKELREFVEKYQDEEDIYEDPITLKRVPNDVQ
jgi:hypothetical protein